MPACTADSIPEKTSVSATICGMMPACVNSRSSMPRVMLGCAGRISGMSASCSKRIPDGRRPGLRGLTTNSRCLNSG
ncbi:hypothetical protein D3C72_1686650 [compost metagenome]